MITVLTELRAADLRLCRHDLTPDQHTALRSFENQAIEHTATAAQLNSLEQSDLEDALTTWLEDHGIAEPWKLANNLVEASIDANALEEILKQVGQSAFADVLVRVSAQLVDADGGYQLWSKRFDRELADVFAIQDEIAMAIVNELKSGLTSDAIPSSPIATPRRTPLDADAHDLYLRGMYSLNKWNDDSMRRAMADFRQAIERDPAFAPAYAALAEGHMWLYSGLGILSAAETVPQARAAIDTALQLDPNLADAHRVRAAIAMNHGSTTASISGMPQAGRNSRSQPVRRSTRHSSATVPKTTSRMIGPFSINPAPSASQNAAAQPTDDVRSANEPR